MDLVWHIELNFGLGMYRGAVRYICQNGILLSQAQATSLETLAA